MYNRIGFLIIALVLCNISFAQNKDFVFSINGNSDIDTFVVMLDTMCQGDRVDYDIELCNNTTDTLTLFRSEIGASYILIGFPRVDINPGTSVMGKITLMSDGKKGSLYKPIPTKMSVICNKKRIDLKFIVKTYVKTDCQ